MERLISHARVEDLNTQNKHIGRRRPIVKQSDTYNGSTSASQPSNPSTAYHPSLHVHNQPQYSFTPRHDVPSLGHSRHPPQAPVQPRQSYRQPQQVHGQTTVSNGIDNQLIPPDFWPSRKENNYSYPSSAQILRQEAEWKPGNEHVSVTHNIMFYIHSFTIIVKIWLLLLFFNLMISFMDQILY